MAKIQIIITSTREGRVGDKFGKWVLEEAQKFGKNEYELIDLKDFPLPFFNDAVSPAYRQGPHTNPDVVKWGEKIASADGYIFVTAEYNHGYTAVFKNALDSLYGEWNTKPVSFVSYGGVGGGVRAVQQLVQVVRELQMIPLRTGAHLPFGYAFFDEKGNPKPDSHFPDLTPMFTELTKWSDTLKPLRENN